MDNFHPYFYSQFILRRFASSIGKGVPFPASPGFANAPLFQEDMVAPLLRQVVADRKSGLPRADDNRVKSLCHSLFLSVDIGSLLSAYLEAQIDAI
jgi:hypothetical protein